MAFDFNYENTTIQSSGGFKPSKKNAPVDTRTVVDTYADIASIPNPYIGLTVTVKSDETNEGKMTDYKVISLKANGLGVPNMLVNEVKRMNEYLEVSSSGNSSGDLSGYVLKTELNASLSNKVDKVSGYSLVSDTEIARLANVDNYDDTELMNLIPDKTSDLENDSNFISSNDDIDATTINGRTLSGPMTKEEYEALADKDPNTIYLVDDDNVVNGGIPNYTVRDANKALTVNSTGTSVGWNDVNVDLDDYYTKSEVEERIANISTGGSVNLSNYYTKSETDDVVNEALDGHKLKFLTQSEYDSLDDTAKNDTTIVYNITDKEILEDGDLRGLKLQLIGYNLTLSNSLGEIITTVSLQNIAGSGGNGGGGGTVENYGNLVVSVNNITTQPGSTATFTISLDSAPTNSQIVTILSNNNSATVTPESVTFDSNNYNSPQIITVNTTSDFTSASITISNPNMISKTILLSTESSGDGDPTPSPGDGSFVDLVKTLEPSSIQTKMYYSDTGDVIEEPRTPNLICSQFIPVSPNDVYVFCAKDIRSHVYTICEYDENKDFTSRTKNASASVPILKFVPNSTTAYIRIGYDGDSLDNVIFGNVNFEGNLLGSLLSTETGYISSSDGSIQYDNKQSTFDFVSVEGNTLYTISNIAQYTVSEVFVGYYDSSKSFISRDKFTSQSSIEITTPENAAYVRVGSKEPYAHSLTLM